MWRIDFVSGSGVGPRFLPESEVVEAITWSTEKIEPRGERTRAFDSTDNGTSSPVEDVLKVELSNSVESNWNASDSISNSISHEIGIKLSAEKKFGTGKIGVETSYRATVATEKVQTTAKGGRHTAELSLTFEKTVTVPPKTNMQMEVILEPRTVISQFQATVLTRYAEGTEDRRVVKGTLEVKDFVTKTRLTESPYVPSGGV